MSNKILIVEDEERIAKIFQKKLIRFGKFEVDIAGGGEQGLQMMEETPYNLVLLDLVMPEFDGMAVLEELNKDVKKYHNTPIAVLTNLNTKDEKKRAEELGVVGFFGKVDMSTEELISSINELMRD